VRWLAAPLAVLVLAGCGDDGSSDEGTFTTGAAPAPTVASEPDPAAPLVRICDRALADRVEQVLAAQGFRGQIGRPAATGSERLSQCRLDAGSAQVQFSLDAGRDAVRRYFNRITETAQFSGGDPEHAPHPVEGVGAARLAGHGANWIPNIHELLSVRGERVLIASVSASRLRDRQLRAAAVGLSLYVYERLRSR
jgi:hypothetical protein